MRFRTIPPDPSEIPKRWLVGPIAVPLLILLLAWLAELGGHVWNIHGDGVVIMVLFFATALFAIAASSASLFVVIPALRKYPSLRTHANLVCVFLAAAFVLVAICYFGLGILPLFLK